MEPRDGEFERHEQDLKGTGNPDPKSDLKRDENADPRGNLSGERTADGTLSERASELSATEYVEDLDENRNSGRKEAPDSDQDDAE